MSRHVLPFLTAVLVLAAAVVSQLGTLQGPPARQPAPASPAPSPRLEPVTVRETEHDGCGWPGVVERKVYRWVSTGPAAGTESGRCGSSAP